MRRSIRFFYFLLFTPSHFQVRFPRCLGSSLGGPCFFSNCMQLKHFFQRKSDVRLTAQVLSANLPHHGFCLLCCKQLSLSLQLQVLFIPVSGRDLKDDKFFFKSFFRLNLCLLKDCRLCFIFASFVPLLNYHSIVWHLYLEGNFIETDESELG